MSKSQKTTLEVKLADADSDSLGSLPIRIEASDFAISIYPQGHGDFASEDGQGCPLFIEFYRGKLRVIAFPDINTEEPRVIDLSGTREDRRRGITDLHDETPLQKGKRFHEFMSQINPATGTRFTMKEAATALEVDFATFRNLEALWHSPKDTRLKLEGKAN